MSDHDPCAGRGNMAREAMRFLQGPLRAGLAHFDPTSLRTLLGAAERACCLEELDLIIQYQQARAHPPWPGDVVEAIRKACEKAGETVEEGSDRTKVDRARAKAAAAQLSLIARAHKVAHAERQQKERDERDSRPDRSRR